MSWPLIARKEIDDLRRNRQLHWMVALFAILFGLLGYVHAGSAINGVNDPIDLVRLVHVIASVVVPAFALIFSYETIVKRRHNGQLELQLGFPHHRRDVVIGGYVGRFVAVAIVVTAAFWATGAVVVLRGARIPAQAFLASMVVALVLALTYVALGITISASIRSPSWASVAAFSGFLLFVLAWRQVPLGIAYLLNGFELPTTSPWWSEYVATLSPSLAAEEVAAALLPETGATGTIGGTGAGVGFAVIVLAGWIVLVPLAGYLRFDRTDL